MMGKDHWDAVLASSPLNSTAARVASRGYEYTSAVKVGSQLEWENPPKTKPAPKSRDFKNLIGARFGRLNVTGYLGSKNGARWLCRCTCGRYVQRRSKAVLNPENASDRCSHCQHVAHLAREATGKRYAERKALGAGHLFRPIPTPPQGDEN